MLKIYPDTPKPSEHLDELLLQAGEDDSVPVEPPGGIPKQFIPNWIRWPLRVIFLPLVLLDLWAQRIARLLIRPPFKQVGTCKKRGACCHYILIPAPKGIFGKLYYLWNTEILGFYRRDNGIYESEGHKVYVMGCRYLRKNGSCAHYFFRPPVCRNWPLIEHFGHPQIIKGCGFRAIQRKKPDLQS